MISGAHQLSLALIMEHVKPGMHVLDAGSGSGLNSARMIDAGCKVFSVDIDPAKGSIRKPDLAADLTSVPWRFAKDNSFDVVVATYFLQHLIGREVAAWGEIGRILKPGGLLLATGRHQTAAPAFEWDRGDPLRGDNSATLATLCAASGFEKTNFVTFHYDDAGYLLVAPASANAWALTARCTKGLRLS